MQKLLFWELGYVRATINKIGMIQENVEAAKQCGMSAIHLEDKRAYDKLRAHLKAYGVLA